jgi:hypothetical protein
MHSATQDISKKPSFINLIVPKGLPWSSGILFTKSPLGDLGVKRFLPAGRQVAERRTTFNFAPICFSNYVKYSGNIELIPMC